MQPILENRTIEGHEHRLANRYTMSIDWLQSVHISLAGIAAILSVNMMAFSMPFLCLAFAAVALMLLWVRYFRSLRRGRADGAEVLTTFGEKEIIRLCNGTQTMIPYSQLRRITFFSNWLLFEGKKLRFIVDIKGFDGLEAEDIFQHFRSHFPVIPVKRKGFHYRKKQICHMVLCTLMLLVFLPIGIRFPVSESEPLPAVMSHDPKEYAGIPVEEQPCVPFEMDLFSIELPAGFSVHQNGDEYDYILYGENAKVCVDVWFTPMVLIERDDLTLADIAEIERAEEAEWKGTLRCDEVVAVNQFGHLSFSMESAFTHVYYLFLETEHYAVTVVFTCNLEKYEILAEHFDKWEASISVNDIPTGSLLRRNLRRNIGDFSILLPLYMQPAKAANADWCFCSVEDTRISLQVKEYQKTDLKSASDAKEALAEIVCGDSTKYVRRCDHGHPYILESHESKPDRFYYFVAYESNESYYLLTFYGPDEKQEELLEIFEQWDGSVK